MRADAGEAAGTVAARPEAGGPDIAAGGLDPEEFDVTKQSLARPTAIMAVGTFLSRLTGLGRVVAMAAALGVAESRLADSYNLANTLPISLYELLLGGVLTSVFIPVIIEELRTKPKDDAWRSVSAVVTVSLTALAAMCLLVALVAPWIIELFSSRIGGAEGLQQRELAGFFLRVFAPQIALFGFAAIAQGLLNAHGRFAVPMFAPIVNNLFQIGVFLAFAAVVSGVPTNAGVDASTGQKLLLGLGTTGGVALMAVVYFPFLRRLPGKLRARFDFRSPTVRKIVRLASWTFLYVITNTAGLVVSFYLANGVQGGIAAYVAAFAFFQLPIGIAAVSIITALVPRLAAHSVDGNDEAFRATVAGGLRACALLLLPATALLIVLARPLIQTLLEHGIVRAGSVDLVSHVLQLFAIGLLPFAAFLLFMRAYYARQDTRTPGLINIVENGVTIGLDFALFPGLEVRGLALAHTLGYVVGTVVAGALLARRIGGLEWRRTGLELAKIALAAAAAAAAALLAVRGVHEGSLTGEGRALAELLIGGTAGVGAFLLVAGVFGVRDLDKFKRLLPGR
jgi:putative peptidoglycan lipid II flippase